ncbi:MAG: hypothetical protein IJ876_02780 [Elusimicrobiaceae bacterium]|nr:hypothetical protein [Elusimicrobiaceae bacterium]
MRWKVALVSFILFCPCALCYGQLRFASVGGEKGYSAMRASYVADLDNGFILTPQYGYYRMSDKEIDEAGSTSRYGLEVRYELFDLVDVLTDLIWQPQAVGYEGVIYRAGLSWEPFYYFYGIKNPVLTMRVGQERLRSYVDHTGKDLPNGAFRQVGTTIITDASFDIKRLHLQGTWHKVIKYSSRVPQDVTFSWAEVPYMTAVLQGYMKDCYAIRLSYPTDFVTPYVSLARYHYDQRRQVASAVSAGLHMKLWDMELTGGIEVFEPRREDNRKTYFSLSMDVPM